jgi:hypothetical protein
VGILSCLADAVSRHCHNLIPACRVGQLIIYNFN